MPRSSLSAALLAATATLAVSGCQQLPVRGFEQTIEGAYDVETRYDLKTFEGSFSGLAGQWAQPDRAIRDKIVGQVRTQYGASVADAFVRGYAAAYGASLQADIADYLRDEAPAWVMNLQSTMDLVDQQMRTVDMQTTMLLAETDAGLKATQIFNGVAVYEDPTCPSSGRIACDQIGVSSQELLDAEYPVEVISGDYDADQANGSLALTAHELNFNYGRLGLYMLTNLILPDDPTQGVGLRDVTLAAINCRGLAGRLAGDNGTLGVEIAGVDVGLSLNDLIGNCEEGVIGQVNGFVDRFNVPMRMNLSGSTALVDTNRDGRIDQLTGGDLGGEVALQLLGQSKEGPVSGRFTGFRVGDVE